MPIEKFKEAIFSLTERNQQYVNRKGVNSFSLETDRIICDLIGYYNQVENQDPDLQIEEREFSISKSLDEIERLKIILELFGIPLKDFKEMPLGYLELKLEQRKKSDEIPYLALIFIMDLIIDYLSCQTDINSLVFAVMGYQKARKYKWEPIIKFYQEKQFDNISRYLRIVETHPYISEKSIRNLITKDYYGGEIKTYGNKETKQVTAGSQVE